VPALHDEWWKVRAAAAQALGQAGDGRAVEPLASTLQDIDPSVRRAAAWALGRLALPDGIRPLRAAKEDWDVDVAKEAEEALKACQEPLPDVLQKAAADGRAQTLITLLPRLPKDGNARTLIEAVTALRDSTSPEAVPVLLTILKSTDFPLYEAAASALGHLKDRRAVEPLVANLERDSRAIPAAAALGEIGDPQALPYLEEALRRSKDEGVRRAIKDALSKLRAAKP
jgi:HEAT repeat protein